MTISTFYTEGLKAHASMVQDFKIDKLNFQPKIRKYKTINQFSSTYKGCILAKSSKGSIAIRTVLDFKNDVAITTVTLHSNVILNVTYESFKPTYSMVLGSKEWLSQTTKRHLNYIFDSFFKGLKYVTIDSIPYMLNKGKKHILYLDSSYLLDSF
tara:strand:- start:110 stop:574 length:465 start_codon:yes stop_codon:yes gene_type:complete